MADTAWLDAVAKLQRDAMIHRKRGDGLLGQGKTEAAREEFCKGVAVLDQALEILADPRWNRLEELPTNSDLPPDQLSLAKELVEACGARGGLLRRLGDALGALNSYRQGSTVEERFNLESTYNRVNAVKYGLLSGANSMAELEPTIRELEKALATRLAEDPKFGDSGWAWADLGDCRSLLGDVDGAARAYKSFIDKAKSNTPATTLDVLGKVLAKLEETGDPEADAVRSVLERLNRSLTG